MFFTGLHRTCLAAELVRKTASVDITWVMFVAFAPPGILLLVPCRCAFSGLPARGPRQPGRAERADRTSKMGGIAGEVGSPCWWRSRSRRDLRGDYINATTVALRRFACW
jgi:hypothetical protein